jgi:hypothetical protein
MTTKISSKSRHFPYQHPTFGSKNNRKDSRHWKNSPYYWWWLFMKRNQDYIKCCENNGEGELANLYADFGDIRGDDFMLWWKTGNRGANLFAEPVADDNIRLLADGDPAVDDDTTLTISVPLNLPKKFLNRRFREIVAKRHTGERGKQYAKQSKAKYKVHGQYKCPSLERLLLIYDAIKAVEGIKPRIAYWRIAKPFYEKRLLYTPGDDQEKLIRLNSSMSRYKRLAEETIKNTIVPSSNQKGQFPAHDIGAKKPVSLRAKRKSQGKFTGGRDAVDE